MGEIYAETLLLIEPFWLDLYCICSSLGTTFPLLVSDVHDITGEVG